ncbi:MAG: endonuclease, partial [Pirellulales bacterium]
MSCRLVMLIALLVVLPPLAGAVTADEAVRLRVLTCNIHHGEGTDGEFDLPRLAKVITDARPDLVALQEVDNKTRRADGVDQAAKLGELTGLHARF